MRTCYKCKIEQPLTNFANAKKGNNGLARWCRKCHKDWAQSVVGRASQKKYREGTGLYQHAVNGAKERNIVWDITKEEYLILRQLTCYYCSDKLPKSGSGLDRKDNSLGYILTNVVPCCWWCNTLKSNQLTFDEMCAAIQAILKVRRNAEI